MRVVALLLALFAMRAGGADLKVSLTAVTPEVAAGAPIVLRATLESTGSRIEDVPVISPEAGNFELWIANLNTGERTRYLGPMWSAESKSSVKVAVEPGNPASTALLLLISGDGAAVFAPARWQINIQYQGLGTSRALYAQTAVTVRDPSSGAESAWWKALASNPGLGKAIQIHQGLRGEPQLARQAEKLVQAYSDAAQTPLAAVALADYYLHDGKQPARALSYYRLAARPSADPLTRRTAMSGAADALDALGAKNEAANVRRQLEAEGRGETFTAVPAAVPPMSVQPQSLGQPSTP